MSSAGDKLQSKLSDHENEKKKGRLFLREIAGPFITWTAIAATYNSLQADTPNMAAWGAVMFSLFALHIGLARWKSQN